MKETTHKAIEFEPIDSNLSPDTLAAGSFGLSGSGKTAFLCTLPGKIGIVTLDDKTRDIVRKRARELGIANGKIVMPKENFVRYDNPLTVAQMDVDKSMKFYTELKLRVLDAVYTLVERKDIDSIGFDGGHQMSELCLLSNYGRLRRIMPRDRGPYNEDMASFFNSLRTKNCVITHKAQEIWSGPEQARRPSGRYEWKGHADLDYAMDVVVEHIYDEKEKNWYMSVNRCNHRPDLLGESGDRILFGGAVTFQMLAMQLWPESNAGVWE